MSTFKRDRYAEEFGKALADRLGGYEKVPAPAVLSKCRLCDGEGRTDGNEDISERAPWSFWENLPPGSDLFVRMGLVKPIDCIECNGTGKVTGNSE